MRRMLAVATVMGTVACGSDPAAVACTEEARPGIVVRVLTEPTLAPGADGAVLTLRDGSFVQTIDDSFDGTILFGATERPGSYDVNVDKEGFRTWHRDEVRVELTPDGCHVLTVELEARLQLP